MSDLPAGTFLRSPALALVAREVYVTGFPSPAGPWSPVGAHEARPLIERASSGPLELPPGPFRFLNLRVLRGRGGRVHLVWGESHATTQSVRAGLPVPPSRVGSLWDAMFDPDAGWSTPHLLHDAADSRDGLLWNSESADAAVAPSGRIDLLVPRTNGAALHLTFDEGRWSEETLPVRALYATMARASDGTLHVAYIGEDPGHRGRLNGFLHLARREGAPWSAPKAMRPGDARGATLPRLFSTRDGVLHLIWGAASPGRMQSGWLRHASSRDDGEHWSATHDLELPRAAFTKWRAGVDRCGAPRVLVSTWVATDSAPIGRVLHSELGGTGWTPLAPVFDDRGVREIVAQTAASGELFVVASVIGADSSSRNPTYRVALSHVVGDGSATSR